MFSSFAIFRIKKSYIWLGAVYMFETTQAHRHWLVGRMLHYNISWTMILNVNSIDRHSSAIWCGYLLFTLFQCILCIWVCVYMWIFLYAVVCGSWSKDNKFCDCSSGTKSEHSRCVLLWGYMPHLICVTCDFSGFELTFTYCTVHCSSEFRELLFFTHHFASARFARSLHER